MNNTTSTTAITALEKIELFLIGKVAELESDIDSSEYDEEDNHDFHTAIEAHRETLAYIHSLK